MLEELERVLKYPRIAEHLKMSQEEIGNFLRYLSLYATVVEPEMRLDVVVQDPSGDRVLECALIGNASYSITGDHHLLEIEEYQGIVILPPAGFIALLNLGKKKPNKSF